MAEIHARLLNNENVLCVQKFSIDFRGHNGVDMGLISQNISETHASGTIFRDCPKGVSPSPTHLDMFSGHLS